MSKSSLNIEVNDLDLTSRCMFYKVKKECLRDIRVHKSSFVIHKRELYTKNHNNKCKAEI